MAYRSSAAFAAALAGLGSTAKFTRPHCPWTNGKVERFNRTLGTEWAYRRPYASDDERTAALTTWLEEYNNTRPHAALGGASPNSRVSPT